jgi:hypothetical protein
MGLPTRAGPMRREAATAALKPGPAWERSREVPVRRSLAIVAPVMQPW